MEGSELTSDALEEVRALRRRISDELAVGIELPDPGPVLDIASRAGDKTRIYKHIAQNASLHAWHFKLGSLAKVALLIDGFPPIADADNPLMEYAAARAMLELNAHTHTVMTRLTAASELANERNWQDLGEKFFSVAVRARFGTRDEAQKRTLVEAGFPKRRTEPFNIAESIERLSTVPGQEDAARRYAALCDFVHHNMSSMVATFAGVEEKLSGQIGKGGFKIPGPAMVIRYADPAMRTRTAGAELERNVSWLLHDAQAAVEWITNVPDSPFPEALSITLIGTPHAFVMLPPERGL